MSEWQRCAQCGKLFAVTCDARMCEARAEGIAEGRRIERERIASWLGTKPTRLEEKSCSPPEPRDRVLARAIRNGEHEEK